jgi:hypothetical protein
VLDEAGLELLNEEDPVEDVVGSILVVELTGISLVVVVIEDICSEVELDVSELEV